MKTTLFLSALAASLAAVSTTSFAQNYVAYSQALGAAAQHAAVAPSYPEPRGEFTRPYPGHQGSAGMPRNRTAHEVAPAIGGPAPAQGR